MTFKCALICPCVQLLEASIRPDTSILSVMTVNNEIGVKQPIEEIGNRGNTQTLRTTMSGNPISETSLVPIQFSRQALGSPKLFPCFPGRICRSKGVFFHTDAAQAVGKVPINVSDWKVDLMSISGHKLYGPKGRRQHSCTKGNKTNVWCMNGARVHRCRRPVCATAAPGSFGASAERRWAGEGLTLGDGAHPAGCWPGSSVQHRPAGDGGIEKAPNPPLKDGGQQQRPAL